MGELHRSTLLVITLALAVVAAGIPALAVAQTDGEPVDRAVFEVTDVRTNTPITAGETIEVTVEVTNTGTVSGETEVWFNLDQYDKDYADVELDPGETKSVLLTYVSKSRDSKDWTLRVNTADDTVERTVTIEPPPTTSQRDRRSTAGSNSDAHPNFEIVELDVDGPITAGDPLRMNATVENTGRALGEKLVWFTLDGHTVNETIIELPEDRTKTVAVVYNTSVDQAGPWTVSANTSDDVARESVRFAEPESELVIREIDVDGSVRAGELLTVTVDVANVGDIAERSPVQLAVDGHFIDEERIKLAPNESTGIELQYRTRDDVTGELNLTVSTNESHTSRIVTVAEPTPVPTSTETPTGPTPTPTTSIDATTEPPTSPAEPRQWMPPLGVSVAVAAALAGAVVVTRLGL
ncbi:CARDB domain-containing protein [Halobellus sp. GM3]|uniref:CARDB domain-containing protein n=1 Tax=Halobellus sp. GM3 TaxID=3458410 RepID=UPI00403DDE99